MCFQGFAHHSCGHRIIHEELCDEARSLELPFFLKIACPNYGTSRQYSNLKCGIGQYYCSQSPNGEFIDRVHHFKAAVDQRLRLLASQTKEYILPERHKINQRLLQQCGGDQVKVAEMSMQDEEACKLKAIVNKAVAERSKLEEQKRRVEHMISRFKVNLFHQEQELAKAGIIGIEPRLPPELLRKASYGKFLGDNLHAGASGAAVPVASGQRVVNTAAGAIPPRIPPALMPLLSGRAHGATEMAQRNETTVQGHPQIVPQSSHKHRQRGSEKTRERSTRTVPASVRRSGRVKGNINYAENSSDTSTHSTPSPEKSDTSGFSPEKPPGSSLPSASASPAPKTATWSDYYKRGIYDRSAIGTLASEAEIRSLPEQQASTIVNWPRGDVGLATRPGEWLVNKGDTDPTLAPGVLHKGAQRPYGIIRKPNEPVGKNYPAFGQTKGVFHKTPSQFTSPVPQATQNENHAVKLDKSKRRSSAVFSPAFPSAKKTRLSLPGEEERMPKFPPARKNRFSSSEEGARIPRFPPSRIKHAPSASAPDFPTRSHPRMRPNRGPATSPPSSGPPSTTAAEADAVTTTAMVTVATIVPPALSSQQSRSSALPRQAPASSDLGVDVEYASTHLSSDIDCGVLPDESSLPSFD